MCTKGAKHAQQGNRGGDLTWVLLLGQLLDELAHVALLQSSHTHWELLQHLKHDHSLSIGNTVTDES